MIHREISELFEKLLNNQCSEEEADLILELLADESNGKLFHTFISQQLKESPGDHPAGEISEPIKNALHLRLERILEASPDRGKKPARRLPRMIQFRYAAAAVFVLLAVMSYLLIRRSSPVPAAPAPLGQGEVQPIVAGSNKAILTLSDGRQIDLDTIAAGDIATQSNAVIKKMANGLITYEAKPVAGGAPMASLPAFNTISAPKGGQFQVVLPDGSKVWLNAASSLKYPARFDADQRVVELSGEGYFEIEKKGCGLPFIVVSNHQKIEVLGTMFNVNAYTEESYIRTTLINGMVRVSGVKGDSGGQPIASKTLRPGQQSELSGDDLTIGEGNIEAALAWKNGMFQFDSEDIHVVMRKIARWYNVEVEYHGNMKRKFFSGTISRYGDVQDVLHLLQTTGTATFTVKDRKIDVF